MTPYCVFIFFNNGTDDHSEGLSVLRDVLRKAIRVMGSAHPFTRAVEQRLWETLLVPRFKVGARVKCCMGEGKFFKGTVKCHNYSEDIWEPEKFVPYQVELDDKSIVSTNAKGLIFVPGDDDRSIRAAASDSSGDDPTAAPPANPDVETGDSDATA